MSTVMQLTDESAGLLMHVSRVFAHRASNRRLLLADPSDLLRKSQATGMHE